MQMCLLYFTYDAFDKPVKGEHCTVFHLLAFLDPEGSGVVLDGAGKYIPDTGDDLVL